MEQVITRTLAERRFAMLVLIIFRAGALPLARYIPAHRATAVDPVIALRYD